MARSRVANNNNDPSLPPWERANVAQVPYLDSTSPSLSNAEREALPCLWAAQTNNTPKARPRVDTHARGGSNSSQRRGPSSDECFNSWGVKTPLTAPPPPRPYDTPVYIPPAPKSTPNPPTFTKPPPTPPDSDHTDIESFKTTSSSGSPPSKQVVKPLPQLPSHVEPYRTSLPRKAASTHEPRKSAGRIHRWKLALKEMFTHQPVDESDLVHISAQRHWTDE